MEHCFDLRLKVLLKHLICLVNDANLGIVSLQEFPLHHVNNATWRTDNDMNSLLQHLRVLSDICATAANMNLDTCLFTNCVHDESYLLRKLACWCDNNCLDSVHRGVDCLKQANTECSCLTCSRLGLCNCVVSLDQRHDSFLLDD